MREQIDEILSDFQWDIGGAVASPAAKHLMYVNDNCMKLGRVKKEAFHSTVAKLLYLEKRARPDLETNIAFLTTRVSNPDKDDWKKLIRLLSYIKHTK